MRRWRLASGRRDGERVFAWRLQGPWERVREAAGFPELTFHGLRHTYAVHQLAAGLTVHAVAELLGHSGAAQVLRTYGHALPSEVAEAGERLEAWRIATRSATRASKGAD